MHESATSGERKREEKREKGDPLSHFLNIRERRRDEENARKHEREKRHIYYIPAGIGPRDT